MTCSIQLVRFSATSRQNGRCGCRDHKKKVQSVVPCELTHRCGATQWNLRALPRLLLMLRKWNSISRNSGDDSSHHGDNTEWYIFSLSWWIRRRLQYWFYATPSLTWTRWECQNLLWLIFRPSKHHSIRGIFFRKQRRISWPCWSIGLWDVEAPTFSRKSPQRWRWGWQPYASAGRPLPPARFVVLISVRG
jgi:hypothetical protein